MKLVEIATGKIVDVDVLNDDDFNGNDDHIDALKEEVQGLRFETKRLRHALQNLTDASNLVGERRSVGDLADAVHSLLVDAAFAREVLAQGKAELPT